MNPRQVQWIYLFLSISCAQITWKNPFGKRTSGLSVILQTLHIPPKILGAELRAFVRINVRNAPLMSDYDC